MARTQGYIEVGVGTATVGEWCPDHALPHLITVPLVIMSADGVGGQLGTWLCCDGEADE